MNDIKNNNSVYGDNIQTGNKLLMREACNSLKGRWGLAIGSVFIFTLIIFAVQFLPKIGFLAAYFISGAMTVGICTFALRLSRDNQPGFLMIFNGFKKFWVSLWAYFLFGLFVFLWALIGIIPLVLAVIAYNMQSFDLAVALFCLALIGFIPSFIASLSYSMTFFIVADENKIGPLQAVCKSKRIMHGSKWKLFCLGWRFFWWFLLSAATAGIGFLWLVPYVLISKTKFYEDILKRSALG